MSTSPFTRLMDYADALNIAAQDDIARFTCDMRQRPVGTGDSITRTFDTTFLNATSLEVWVSELEQVVAVDFALSRGTGTDGVDQIVFTVGSTPANGAKITAIPDKEAIDATIMGTMIDDATEEVYGYLGGRYNLSLADPKAVAICRQWATVCFKMACCARRRTEPGRALELKYKNAIDALVRMSNDKQSLPPGAVTPEVTSDEGSIGSEPVIFGSAFTIDGDDNPGPFDPGFVQ